MKKNWKRVLSLLLTVCMIAGLLVLPAAAVDGEGDEGGDTPTATIAEGEYDYKNSSAASDTTPSTAGITWGDIQYGSNGNDHGPHSSGAATLKVNTSEDKFTTLVVYSCQYGADGKDAATLAATTATVNGAAQDMSVAVVSKDPVYTIYNVKGEVEIAFAGQVYIHGLKVTESDTETTLYTVSVDEDIANGTVTVNPSGKVPAGTEITVTATAADNYELVADSLKYGDTAIADGKFTVSADATVTAQFAAKTTPEVKLDKTFVEVEKDGTATVNATVQNLPDGATATWTAETSAAGVATADVTDGAVTVTGVADGDATITVKATIGDEEYTATFNATVWTSPATSWDFKSAAFAAAMEGNANNEVTWRGLTIGAANKAYTTSHGFNGYGVNTIAVPVGVGENTITVAASYASGSVALGDDTKTISAVGDLTFTYTATEAGTVTLNTGAGTYIGSVSVTTEAVTTPTTKDITFTVPTGAELAELKADGETATLTEGKLTVATDAVVTFKVTVTDDAKELDTVTGATEADGVYTVNADAVVIALKEKTTPTVDKTDLKAALADAKAIDTTAVEVSAAGDGSDVYTDKQWVTQTVKDALTTAITNGETINAKADATEEEVSTATTALTTATTNWQPQAGTKLKTIVYTAPDVTEPFNGQAHKLVVTVTEPATGATVKFGTAAGSCTSDTCPDTRNVADSRTLYFEITADGYTTVTGSANVTITPAAKPAIKLEADIDSVPSTGGTVNFTVSDLPQGSQVAPTISCDQDGAITLTKQSDGTYTGTKTIAAADEAKTHTVTLSWTDTNFEAIDATTCVIEQMAPGAVAPAAATGLKISDIVNYADLGVTATAANNKVTYTIDEAALLAAWANAEKKAVITSNSMNHDNVAYLCFTFEAPAGADNTWTVSQKVNGTLEETKHALDGTDVFDVWTVDGKMVIGDWFSIADIAGDTLTVRDATAWNGVQYHFFNAEGELQSIVQLNVERKVTPAPVEYNVTVTAGANGTATASVDKAAAGTEVTLTVTPATGYVVDQITSADVTVTDNKFTMPAKDVTINVTFKAEGGESVEDATLFDPALLVVAADNTPVTTDMLKAVFGNRFSAAVITEGDHADYVKARRNSDGVTTSLEIKENGKASFTFVIKSGETFDVTAKLSSNNSTDATAYTLRKGDTEVATGDVGVSSAPTEVTWEGLTEGTYTLTSSGAKSIRIIRLEMTAPQGGGETKDITFTVPAGAELAELKVGGETASLTEGKLTVATDAVVTFKVTVTDNTKELDTVTGATEADGVYTVNADAVVIALKDKTSTPVVNKDALKADIKAAQDLVKNTTFTAQEDNLAGEKYWDNDMKADYEAAITAAQAVVDNAEATADDVATAKTDLAAATATFKAGKTDGTKVLEGDELKAALADAITAATTAKEGVEANDATDPDQVTNGTKYVPTAVMTALEDALEDAEALKALLDDEDAENDPDAAAVTAALVALKNATKDFQPETGTKTAGRRPSGGSSSVSVDTSKTSETLTDGTKRVTETAKDGTVTVTDTKPDGTKTVTTTTPAGEVTTDVTLGKGVETVTVSVPMENANTGMVAVIVKADGTEEIIRDSVVENGNVVFDLDGDAKVKIVNNAKKFVDIDGHWAKSDVDYVTAREFFNGVDATHFSPDTAMTRAMLATVLFRLDGETKTDKAGGFSDVKTGDWFVGAVDWAAQAGIINGYTDGTFGPNRSITREELVVMFYRYAGAPEVEGDDSLIVFNDADQISSWAELAMRWAVKNGIVNGRGAGILDPRGNATRAEVSAVLQRYVRLAK